MSPKFQLKTKYTKWLSLCVVPAILGTFSVQAIHAQAKEPDIETPTSSVTSANPTSNSSVPLRSGNPATANTNATTTVSNVPSDSSGLNAPAPPKLTEKTPSNVQAKPSKVPQPKTTQVTTQQNQTPAQQNPVKTTPPVTPKPTPAPTPVNDSAIATISSTEVDTIKDNLNQSLSKYDSTNNMDVQLTNLTLDNTRLTGTLLTNQQIATDSNFLALEKISQSLIADNRRYYLQQIAGKGVDLYFTLQAPNSVAAMGTVFRIPIIVQAVDTTGKVLETTTATQYTGVDGIKFNQQWQTTTPKIDGYTLIPSSGSNDKGVWDKNFNYAGLNDRDQIVAKYVYTPTEQQAQIVIVDDKTDQVLQTLTTTGAYGTVMPYDLNTAIAPYLEQGYTLTSSEIPANGIAYNQAGILQKFMIHLAPSAPANNAVEPSQPASVEPSQPVSPIESLIDPEPISEPVSELEPVQQADQVTKDEPDQSIADEPIKDEPAEATVISSRPASLPKLPNAPLHLKELRLASISLLGKFTLEARLPHLSFTPNSPVQKNVAPANTKKSVATALEITLANQPDHLNPTRQASKLSKDIHLKLNHHHSAQNLNHAWAVTNPQPVVKTPGGIHHHSQLSRYLVSLSGIINYGERAKTDFNND